MAFHNDDDDPNWVELRRFDDAVEAEITLNFLRDHGVTAKILGNSGMTSVFNRFTTVMDIRVVVPDTEAYRAREVLDAMVVSDDALVPEPTGAADTPDGEAAPYRARPALPPTSTEPSFRKRYRSGPMVLWTIPGGAHFYARHNRAGLLFGAAIVSLYLVGLVTWTALPMIAALLCQACDALLGVLAVDRFNAGRVPSTARQTTLAGAAVAGSVVAAMLLSLATGGRAAAAPGLPADAAPVPQPQ